MTTENIRLRSEFLNTQVIARDTGKRLGVVKEVLVDMDRREVVALGLRDNMLAVSGILKYMYLNSICQTGDVILVEDEEALDDVVDVELYNKLVKCEVVTETKQQLGKVRDFQFDADDGKVSAITIASLGIPQIPDQLVSTYELSIDDVVASGPDRLIVFEGSEERLTQITVGLLERLGLGSPAWEREDEGYYPPTIKAENQLGTGVSDRPPIATPVETRTPVMEEQRWDEDWQDSQPAPPIQQKAQAVPYDDYEEEGNWGNDDQDDDVYDVDGYEPVSSTSASEIRDSSDDEDMWDDDDNPQPLNIPQKQVEKIPEYEDG